ncbi:MAG: penicillin-binding protein 2 [Nitrospinota bacterium]|nr:MAG: penicillin-binding protein 2 [Nitrospinota bacterium]
MARYRSPGNGEVLRFRIALLMGGVVFCFILFLLRLWHLQILQGQYYARKAEENRVRIVSQRDIRGKILDRAGRAMATNRPSFNLFLRPEDVPDMKRTLLFLTEELGLDGQEVERKLKTSSAYQTIPIARDLNRGQVAYFLEHRWDFPGLSLEVEPLRSYRLGEVAAHVLGYIGEINEAQWKKKRKEGYQRGDFIGQYGIEQYFESVLRGQKGRKQIEVDVVGRELRVLRSIPPRPGHNVVLTIDLPLQRYIEEELSDEYAGAVVVLDPQSGEVLALVSRPAFDPNLFAKGISRRDWMRLLLDPRHPLQNRAIAGQYPPGSVFKIVMAAAGLEEGAVQPQTAVNCPGYFPFGRRIYRDWKPGGHGILTLHGAIVESCDVYFYRLGNKLGIDTIARYARGFGLGEKTGIDLPHEKSGLVPSAAWKKRERNEPWYPGETISVAIGQGYNLVTPIQLASLISAVANGGTLWKPQLIKRIETADGKVVQEFSPQVRGHLPVHPQNLQVIREALYGVVNEAKGTGRRARIEGFGVAGKTGTVQVVSLRHEKELPPHLRDHGWFVAFAPFDHPRIALAILGEHGGKGGSAYAPLAKKIIERYFDLIPPQVAQGSRNRE